MFRKFNKARINQYGNAIFLKELDIQLDKVTKFFSIEMEEYVSDANQLDKEFATFNIPLSKEPLAESSAFERLDSRLTRTSTTFSSTVGSDTASCSIPFYGGQNYKSNVITDTS